MTQPNKSLLLGETQSVCPICLRRIDAQYVAAGDSVFLKKNCPDHGDFEIPLWEGVSHFHAWRNQQHPAQSPVNPRRKAEQGCPYDCGLCENHLQASCCVLLEVTDRCNLHCPVCFASSGKGNKPDPSLETIERWYDGLLEQGGPFNIQLSGGEPTLREDLPEIIRLGRKKGFSFFQLNTNGLRLADEVDYPLDLAAAGLNTVFLQFDSLNAEACAALRGRDLGADKRLAIEHCALAGLGVVLVPTVRRGINDRELGVILDFAAEHLSVVRGVHFQPMSFFGRYQGDPLADRLTLPALLKEIEEQTQGRLKVSDFLPGGAEHPLCSFHAQYRIRNGQWELIQSAGNSGAGCCGTGSATSDAARRTLARQWSAVPALPQQDYGKDYKLDSLNAFFEQFQRQERETLAVSGMAFQDAWNLDLTRLSRCYINVVDPEGALIPFCAYNLTSREGKTLYRR